MLVKSGLSIVDAVNLTWNTSQVNQGITELGEAEVTCPLQSWQSRHDADSESGSRI